MLDGQDNATMISFYASNKNKGGINVTSKRGCILIKLKKVFLLSALILIIYFVFIKDKFPIVDELPIVMQNEFDIVLDERTNEFL